MVTCQCPVVGAKVVHQNTCILWRGSGGDEVLRERDRKLAAAVRSVKPLHEKVIALLAANLDWDELDVIRSNWDERDIYEVSTEAFNRLTGRPEDEE